MTYSEKLKDPRWQRKRLEVFNAAKFKCQDCGAKDKPLNAHHCLYIEGREPWEYPLEELRSLCDDCHDERHSLEHDTLLEFKRMRAKLDAQQLVVLMTQILIAKRDGASMQVGSVI